MISKESERIKNIRDKNTNEIQYYLLKEKMTNHSDYFKMITTANSDLFVEKQTKEIVLKEMDYITFYQIIFYCYNYQFPDENNYNMYDWLSLLHVSSRFLFNDIIKYCEYKLLDFTTKENITELYKYADVITLLLLLFKLKFDNKLT